jgi:hypothetical protein
MTIDQKLLKVGTPRDLSRIGMVQDERLIRAIKNMSRNRLKR